MIRTVSFERTTFAPLPHKFEAGTPNIAGAIGLAAAIGYLTDLELQRHREKGLEGVIAVQPLGKLATTWADIKESD